MLRTWDEARVTRELNAAGYSRGLLTGMYAERLVATMRCIADQEIESNENTLERGSSAQVAKLLLPQRGVGPKVLETFLFLRSSRRRDQDGERAVIKQRKKLIEVALPLDAINKASAREKSIRHGHPSTLHLWWARRPLAAARAVIFAQMVDDPSAHPDLFPTEKEQENGAAATLRNHRRSR